MTIRPFSEYINESKVVKSIKVGDFDHQLHEYIRENVISYE